VELVQVLTSLNIPQQTKAQVSPKELEHQPGIHITEAPTLSLQVCHTDLLLYFLFVFLLSQ